MAPHLISALFQEEDCDKRHDLRKSKNDKIDDEARKEIISAIPAARICEYIDEYHLNIDTAKGRKKFFDTAITHSWIKCKCKEEFDESDKTFMDLIAEESENISYRLKLERLERNLLIAEEICKYLDSFKQSQSQRFDFSKIL